MVLNDDNNINDISKNTYHKILEKIDGINVLKANTKENGALKWLLLAEKYNLIDLKQSSINFIADNYDILQNDTRLLDISIQSYHAIAKKIQKMINVRRKKDHNHQHVSEREVNYHEEYTWTLYHFCRKNSCDCHCFKTIKRSKDPYSGQTNYNCWKKPDDNEWDSIISKENRKDCYGNIIKISE